MKHYSIIVHKTDVDSGGLGHKSEYSVPIKETDTIYEALEKVRNVIGARDYYDKMPMCHIADIVLSEVYMEEEK